MPAEKDASESVGAENDGTPGGRGPKPTAAATSRSIDDNRPTSLCFEIALMQKV
jgi:hypothetical protein